MLFYCQTQIPAESVGRAKTSSFLTNSSHCCDGTQGPLTTAHTEKQLSCCHRLDKRPLEFHLHQQLREGCKSNMYGSSFSLGVPLGSQQAGTQAAVAGLLRHQPCMSAPHLFLSLFHPTLMHFKNLVESHQKKHFCLLPPTL